MAPSKKEISSPLQLSTGSPRQTIEMGRALGALCQAGDVICLQGTLGAGKTHFVKGLALGLGIESEANVTSPTFVLLKKYSGRLELYHFDAYRLETAGELEEIGCQEIFDGKGVSVIEWADHVAECLPEEHFLITMRIKGEQQRDILFGAVGEKLHRRMNAISRALEEWTINLHIS